MDKEEMKELRKNVDKSHMKSDTAPPPDLELGMRVRIKIPKGKLDKMSTPNWKPEIHTITEIVKPKVNARVTRYKVSSKGDVMYSKNDLQVILEDPEPPPQAKAKERVSGHRRQTKEANEPVKSSISTRSMKAPLTKTDEEYTDEDDAFWNPYVRKTRSQTKK
jgi:hypothetical protein